jgi:hypothetical protein
MVLTVCHKSPTMSDANENAFIDAKNAFLVLTLWRQYFATESALLPVLAAACRGSMNSGTASHAFS